MNFYCILIHCNKISDLHEIFSKFFLLRFKESHFVLRQNSELLDAYLNSVKHSEGHLPQVQPKNFKKNQKSWLNIQTGTGHLLYVTLLEWEGRQDDF